MADALDYHYGIPMHLLKFNQIPSLNLWLYGNVGGNGDIFNSIAIYLGSDNFGSLIQLISILLFSSIVFAEFRMERVICTTKKTSNCGAYIYNSLTGEVYFCDSEECKEVKTPIEIFLCPDNSFSYVSL